MSVDHPHQCTVEVQQTARIRKGATTAHAAQDMSLFLGQQSSGMRVRTHVAVRMRLHFLPLIFDVSGPKCWVISEASRGQDLGYRCSTQVWVGTVYRYLSHPHRGRWYEPGTQVPALPPESCMCDTGQDTYSEITVNMGDVIILLWFSVFFFKYLYLAQIKTKATLPRSLCDLGQVNSPLSVPQLT